jgi:hypothetical protein
VQHPLKAETVAQAEGDEEQQDEADYPFDHGDETNKTGNIITIQSVKA